MNVIPIEGVKSFIVYSDVHLKNPYDELSKSFISSIQTISNVDAVFFIGDIFDFITSSKIYFIQYWDCFFKACQILKKQGIRVYFIEGNHDFGFEHFKSEFLNQCFDIYGDLSIKMQHDKLGNVLFCHGDHIICPPSYLPFRLLVKSKFFQKITSFFVPSFLMQFIFSRYARMNRKKDKYRSLSWNFFVNCIKNYLIGKNIHVLILGHVHVYVDTWINKTHILIGTDWLSKPNFLKYDYTLNTFKRVFLNGIEAIMFKKKTHKVTHVYKNKEISLQ